MRHGLKVGGMVITSDNSAGIGEKMRDVVKAPDSVTAKFAARVALLEQWTAGSEPIAVLLHNFSGVSQWQCYIEGITEVFTEADLEPPPISGSSETNMETLQSGLAVTMIGKEERGLAPAESLSWFIYGVPLVGAEVLAHPQQLADLQLIKTALASGIIERVWPVGSKGIAAEFSLLFGRPLQISAPLNMQASGGPATCVLLGVKPAAAERAKQHFGEFFVEASFK